jgi:predicted outer membrane protein
MRAIRHGIHGVRGWRASCCHEEMVGEVAKGDLPRPKEVQMVRKTFRLWMAPVAILALALAGTAVAQEMPPEGQPPPEAEPAPEEMPPEEMLGLVEPHPLVVLHAINQIQSQLGLMGVNEAQNTDLREFAGDIAERHNALDRGMLETANDLDVDVAGSPEVRMAMEIRLQNLDPQLHMLMEAPPQQFDAAFLDLVERSQQDAIETVTALRDEAQQPRVRAHMDEALETYRAQLQRAQQLRGQVQEGGQPQPQPDQPQPAPNGQGD